MTLTNHLLLKFQIYLHFNSNDKTQELVSAKNGSRLKKRLCLALAVLCIIGLCVGGLIYYGAIKPGAAKSKSALTDTGNPVTLDDVLEGRFYAKHNNASWISDTLLYYRDSTVRFIHRLSRACDSNFFSKIKINFHSIFKIFCTFLFTASPSVEKTQLKKNDDPTSWFIFASRVIS